jgi:hypothetical protein
MKKLLAILWLTVSFANAQDQSTANLITNQWTGVATGSMAMSCPSGGGACSGGPGAMYDPNTNTIHFSYGQSTASQTFAINQALANAGTGIQVRGYTYSWDINNNNYDGRQGSTDILTATVKTFNFDNTALRREDTWVYNTKFNWTTFSGDVNYVNPGLSSDFGNLNVSFTSRDTGFWGGYYGPQVRNVSIKMRYGVDTCASDPLSSVNCSGYANAYLTLQCSGNPLYSAQCPGYAAAYTIQQCTINALYDPSCPGYAAAYLNYQCSINPLYSTTCAGYETTYFNQQCSTNPLYNSTCPGYAEAYFTQQCSLNGLYSTRCPNYAESYAKKSVLEKQGIASTVSIVAQTAEVANTASTSNGSSSIAVVADPVINAAVTSTATSATSTTATVPLVANTNTGAANVTTTSVSTTAVAPTPAPETKPSAPTARQEMQAKREATAKAQAVEKGKNLANEMGKAADMESQKQVQNVVIQAMGFTPGFDAYGKSMVPDAQGYKPFTVYNKQINVDNVKLGRRMYGPSDALHTEMVQSQWEIK